MTPFSVNWSAAGKFFLHNRVHTIARIAKRIGELCPQARVVIGHGQMSEHELESVMRAFVAGDADVLVSTTIIESGLDIPNANTIVIDRADLSAWLTFTSCEGAWVDRKQRPMPI